jgi:lipopolysaccharide/colanic/teichoic acid biosynthesis glycosyltransferase
MYYNKYIKKSIDFIFSFLLILLICPLLLLLAILIFLTNKHNPFFLQRRTGKNGKIFKIIKFKTMNDKRDSHGNLLPDSERLTGLGQFIRNTSLDEIPQLINVLKGDMSLIGPRPLLPEYLEIYNDFQIQRHNVRPGITGWAQVNGRNAISWKKKFEYDVWYVENCTFALDFKILLLTVKKVIKSEGIYAEDNATTEKFNGNN